MPSGGSIPGEIALNARPRSPLARGAMATSRGGRDRSPAQSRQGHCRSVEGFAARPMKNKFRSLFADVRFWPKADISSCAAQSAGGKADMAFCTANVRF